MVEAQKKEFLLSLKRLRKYFDNLKDIHNAMHAQIVQENTAQLGNAGEDSEEDIFKVQLKQGDKKSVEEGILRPEPPTALQIRTLQQMDVDVDVEEMNAKEYPDTSWFAQATEAIE
jgi:hypothetical protein